MAVIRNEQTGKWEVRTRYTDWQGAKKQKTKRGFRTKGEALRWEEKFALKASDDIDMIFSDFVETYKEDIRPRLKENTWLTKECIIDKKILPYFKDKKLSEIRTSDVIAWQNEIMKLKDRTGKPYSQTYLKTLHNQLSAILNHAVNMYGLRVNVARQAGNMGKEQCKEMQFWTEAEYEHFVEAVADKEESYMAFEILYWTGMRLGELLALTPADFDLEQNKLRINKSYQRIHKEDVITTPKTPKSNRIILIPQFLSGEMKRFLSHFYSLKENERIFTFSKSFLHHEMDRGCKASGIKRIRIHDLRHSHVSLLINMGFSALAIGDRVGHEATDITYRYAHLYPTVQTDMARQLNTERREFLRVTEKQG
ncbi:AP2-like DNA-binding integrase domain-containing protein [Lachnospiraceae bacterium NK3A20]|nr:AP2-like DNA-binding integrase domain-containing protein [Lachnospiraceae bacterium NK3A20]